MVFPLVPLLCHPFYYHSTIVTLLPPPTHTFLLVLAPHYFSVNIFLHLSIDELLLVTCRSGSLYRTVQLNDEVLCRVIERNILFHWLPDRNLDRTQ